MFQKLHSRLGDFWWYSMMLFIACRSGDVIQAFIGLWLVPKYVGAAELGAVMPLQSLAGFLTTPLAIIAVVFSKYVNVYATRGEYGKVRSFIRDVFSATAVLFVVCLGGAYLVMPFFYERLRIASGSLTFLILLCGLTGNVNMIVTSAQQGLKRFKTMSVMNIIGAPIRLVTLLVAMPFRALSGYILGQTTPPATTSALSILDIHQALKGYAPDTTWRRDLPAIWKYLLPVAVNSCLSSVVCAIGPTIYRQRLPEVESAAYYMLTRFTEVINYVSCAMTFVLVPLASEAHEKGCESYSTLRKAIVATIFATAAASVALAVFGRPLLSLQPVWRTYVDYAPLFPVLTATAGMCAIVCATTTYEMSCRRFSATFAILLINTLWIILLVGFSGFEFFRGILPDAAVDFVASLHVNRLSVYTWASALSEIVRLVVLRIICTRQSRKQSPAPQT